MTTETDEREILLDLLDNQRRGTRAAVHGLSEEQLRSVPSASAMSLGGLLKHVITGEHRAIGIRVGGLPDTGDPIAEWQAGWALEAGESGETLLGRYADVAAQTTRIVRERPIDEPVDLPESVRQWMPPGMVFDVRGILLHSIEETARHAGHADIIRESIDGMQAGDLAGGNS